MNAKASPVIWTRDEADQATRGLSTGAWSATGVSIDSRTLTPGDLFIALRGPNFDGHAFAAGAAEAGAAAIVAARETAGDLAASVGAVPVLGVDDTMMALEDLGRRARARTNARVIGVTGSVGKTGTKEALKLALDGQGAVSATLGNLNNHWGLPLSLARMPAATDFGVFEMGMNHPGEIAPLSTMARPDVAVITEVVDVHAEFFASVEEIADAKAEIFSGVDGTGTAVLNRDNPLFPRLVDHAKAAGVGRIVSFGAHEKADSRLLDCRLFGDASDVSARIAGQDVHYRIGTPGRHVVINSLAVLSAIDAAGGDVPAAAERLAELSPMKGRGARHQIRIDGGAFVLIDESYNASPASMKAAINVLAKCQPGRGGRRIAVLGDMLELGARSEALHEELAETLEADGTDLVFTAGQYMSALWDVLPAGMRGGHASMAKRLVPIVTAAVRDGDVLMVKGSLGSRMGQIVEALAALGDRHGDDIAKAANGE